MNLHFVFTSKRNLTCADPSLERNSFHDVLQFTPSCFQADPPHLPHSNSAGISAT